MDLPDSECQFGYTSKELKDILGDRFDYFWHWMRGQTISICDARVYNSETKDYDQCCNGIANGGVVYRSDLKRFLLGLTIID